MIAIASGTKAIAETWVIGVNKNDIIRMIGEAGDMKINPTIDQLVFLERFANLVAADEREKCAKAAEAIFEDKKQDDIYWGIPEAVEAIRARSRE